MIQMVGVVSQVSRIYQLSCDVKQGEDWKSVLNIPSQPFSAGELLWFAVTAPLAGSAFRIQETGGEKLDIQELYFSFAVQDRMMTAISRSEWMAMPNKNQMGQPTCFYWDRTLKPTLSLWPTPTPLTKTLFFTCTRMMEDAGDLLNQIQIPSRFYEALVSGLAWKLAVKYLPEKAALLKSDYDAAFASASGEDTEDVPLRIGVYWQGGYAW